jgi:D-3-phosphoglycerate dehydrogenase
LRGSGKFKVLVTDKINPDGLKTLSEHPGVELVMAVNPEKAALESLLPTIDAWLVRSETKVTADFIKQAGQLRLIGRAGVGVDNIDVEDASRHGIAVINAPEANTISACEHTFGLILALSRNIAAADRTLKAGGWDRSKFMGVELEGKTLGLVGLGRIGREVAKRAKAFGMQVVAYDPFMSKQAVENLGAQLLDFKEVLATSDYVSLHVPVSEKTRDMINAQTLGWFKKGARLVNCARGELIDCDALLAAIEAGHIAGAALDVFKEEPLSESDPLRKSEKIVLTPHLGASTAEAQLKVAEDLSTGVLEFIDKGMARNSINLPGFDPKTLETLGPWLDLADTMGRFLGQILSHGVKSIDAKFHGEIASEQKHPLSLSALKGLLSTILEKNVTFINAPLIAQDRGIETSESSAVAVAGIGRLMTLTAQTDGGELSISGTVGERGVLQIVRFNGLSVDVNPKGRMLVLTNQDEPGIIGMVGTLLGKMGVNIADMRVGRKGARDEAVMIITVDEDPRSETLDALKKIEGIKSVRRVVL